MGVVPHVVSVRVRPAVLLARLRTTLHALSVGRVRKSTSADLAQLLSLHSLVSQNPSSTSSSLLLSSSRAGSIGPMSSSPDLIWARAPCTALANLVSAVPRSPSLGSIAEPGYGIQGKPLPRYLVAEHMAVPQAGGEPINFIPFLPEALQRLCCQAERLFCGPPVVGRNPKARNYVRPKEYPRVLQLLRDRRMVEFTPVKPLRINGFFGVPKNTLADPLSRVITNCAATNYWTAELPKVTLPSPENLAYLPPSHKWGCGLDVESYYNTLRLPTEWRRYFGLPRVRGWCVGMPEHEWVYPQSTTLPMGWTGSVVVGQLVHEAIFSNILKEVTILYPTVKFVNLRDIHLGAWREYPSQVVIFYSVYLDDLNLFGADRDLLDQCFTLILAGYRRAHLPVKESKLVRPTQGLKVLGVWLDLVCGEVRPTDKSLSYLYEVLPLLARSRQRVERRILEAILGKVVWPLLLVRCGLSVLSATYAQVQSIIATGPQLLWGTVRSELVAIWGLLPAIRARLRGWDTLVLATDATGTDASGRAGFGVVYTRVTNVPSLLGYLNLNHGILPPTPLPQWGMGNWRWAISHNMTSRSHVNLHEMMALLLGARAALRHGHKPSERLLMLCDNQAVVGAVRKGRSSSPSLNCLLRRWCSFLLTHDLGLPWVPYVASGSNPADAPSRAYRDSH